MAKHRAKSNRLSVCLIKAEVQRLEDIIECNEQAVAIPNIGLFFFEQSHPHPPDWVTDFFGNSIGRTLNILSSSATGVLVSSVPDGSSARLFAIPFGVGRYLLKEGVVEERFGLKVALNSVEPNSFRSIDKVTLGSVPKHSHEQMSRDVPPGEFGIDIEQDLVSSVTGKSRDPRFGRIITGKAALSVSVKVDIANIREFLSYALDRYKSDDYKPKFDWIDQIAELRDPVKVADLNANLIDRLRQGNLNKVWMAVPELIDWSDLKGFRYGKRKRADLHDDLDVPTFLATLAGVPVTLELLKGQNVYMISAKSDDVAGHWSAFRCTYAEIELVDHIYVLSNGKWYAIAKGFTDQVLADFASIPQSTIALPDCAVKDEEAYNALAAQSLVGACCMDQRFVYHGGGHNKVEFCDLLTPNKQIVHIKKYAGSSVFSHLFSQGVVSGELFAGDSQFRQKLNPLLPAGFQLADTNARPNTHDYEVIYGIISNSHAPLDIPFFSKVSLRNARRRLTSFGYQVAIKKIQKL